MGCGSSSDKTVDATTQTKGARGIVIFECEGGADKGFDGHRKDTLPIVTALAKRGVRAEVVYYRNEWVDSLLDYVTERAVAYISRVNTRALQGGEKPYFDFLSALSEKGLVGMSPPDVMASFESKDALAKLAGTGLVPDDTYAYYDSASLREKFAVTLSRGERILKQNRGAGGVGMWRVRCEPGVSVTPGEALPPDTRIMCTQAADNHTDYFTLQKFMDICEPYLAGDGGLVVDTKFLPRVKEGEIRVLSVAGVPVFVVHKKRADGAEAFSAALHASSARYTYESPQSWPVLTNQVKEALPKIGQLLGFKDPPLVWTADFLVDNDAAGSDKYTLSELRCACVCFANQLDSGIPDLIAEEVLKRVRFDSAAAPKKDAEAAAAKQPAPPPAPAPAAAADAPAPTAAAAADTAAAAAPPAAPPAAQQDTLVQKAADSADGADNAEPNPAVQADVKPAPEESMTVVETVENLETTDLENA
ncbi:hypothetical protein DIPPA_22635 [Diplonema papillatum]|nr:hypothetical protein DIPPA_22635 [Diplonema papillatum]